MEFFELMSPAHYMGMTPKTKTQHEDLNKELEKMVERFPDTKRRTLSRFLFGHGFKADKAIQAYEDHLKW